ncbi:hypothetical protein ATCC90586_010996 [Pythium insidiosum]|nr:hypothetical protein ATCC90586_010996 [Pythium insidiosum]
MSRIPQLTPRKPRLRPLPATDAAPTTATASFVNTQADAGAVAGSGSAIPSLLKTETSARLRFQPAPRFVRHESKRSNNQEEEDSNRHSLPRDTVVARCANEDG